MLGIAVIGYLIITVAIGLYASSRVHGAKDFMVAGRSLPLYMNFTCVFATWFGAETVLSVSATFAKDGFLGHPGDPFGASCCLILVALFFAKAFYRLDLLTIGDFYRKRYGKVVEVFTSIAITLSYIGWASAQMTALGLVLFVLADGLGVEWLTLNRSIIVGSAIVVVYTIFGGMWSVALTDMIQTAVIVVGLSLIAFIMAQKVDGGATAVITHAYENDKFNLIPGDGIRGWFALVAGFLTVALGSIPQQDVFQRVTSAKDERTAVRGTLLGGSFYFFFAFVPIFIAYAAVVIDPSFTELFSSEDEREVQRILPDMIMSHTPFFAQAIFLGALLSAILSTASGTLLAPSSLFVENVLRPLVPHFEDKRMLLLLRITLLFFAIGATWQAVTSNATMYELVLGAYSVTLVSALVPLALGIYWRRATTQGAILSMLAGMVVWLLVLKIHGEDALVPPQLWGLAASLIGMLVGSLMPQFVQNHNEIEGPVPGSE